MMRGSGRDYCSEDREDYCSGDREHGTDRRWPEKGARGSDTPDQTLPLRVIRQATRPASHQSARIVAPPNGIHTSHSATAFPLSSP